MQSYGIIMYGVRLKNCIKDDHESDFNFLEIIDRDFGGNYEIPVKINGGKTVCLNFEKTYSEELIGYTAGYPWSFVSLNEVFIKPEDVEEALIKLLTKYGFFEDSVKDAIEYICTTSDE